MSPFRVFSKKEELSSFYAKIKHISNEELEKDIEEYAKIFLIELRNSSQLIKQEENSLTSINLLLEKLDKLISAAEDLERVSKRKREKNKEFVKDLLFYTSNFLIAKRDVLFLDILKRLNLESSEINKLFWFMKEKRGLFEPVLELALEKKDYIIKKNFVRDLFRYIKKSKKEELEEIYVDQKIKQELKRIEMLEKRKSEKIRELSDTVIFIKKKQLIGEERKYANLFRSKIESLAKEITGILERQKKIFKKVKEHEEKKIKILSDLTSIDEEELKLLSGIVERLKHKGKQVLVVPVISWDKRIKQPLMEGMAHVIESYERRVVGYALGGITPKVIRKLFAEHEGISYKDMERFRITYDIAIAYIVFLLHKVNREFWRKCKDGILNKDSYVVKHKRIDYNEILKDPEYMQYYLVKNKKLAESVVEEYAA